MRLDNKVAIITGGARGIGKAISVLFAHEGAKVIAADLEEVAYITENVEGYILDVTDSVECEKLFSYVIEKYGKIDILINNAGITCDAMTKRMSNEQWNKVLDVNLTGVFNLTRLIGPNMEEHGKGSIINISSVVAEFGNIGQVNYAATKAGVIGMSKTWAKEFARKGAAVRVNVIAPGFIRTDMIKTIPQDLINKFSSQTMLGRPGESDEVAYAALFLACDESSYITGHTLSVNGGMRL